MIPGTANSDIPLDFIAASNLHEFFEKTAKSLPEQLFCILAITATFDVNANLFYHRLPPISPIRQRSPKL